MSDELNQYLNLTKQYRDELARIETREGSAQQSDFAHPFRTSGEEKQKIARMDADLTAAELIAQNKALEARLAKLEAEPVLRARPSASIVTGDEEYARRYLDALTGKIAFRDLATSTSGAAIPTDMERRIVEKMRQSSVMRQLGRVTQIDSKRTIPVENALPTTALVSEGGTITPADPSFSSAISVVPYKFVTAVTMSQEYIEDAIGNGGIGSGLQYVADKCGLSIALKQEEYMTIGSGSSQPEGIETSAITQIENIGSGGAGNAADTDLTPEMIISAVHRVPPQYRSGSKFAWVMHDSLVATIRKMRSLSATTGEFLWMPGGNGTSQGLTAGAPGTIYGVPYYINQYMNTATDTTNGAVVAVVGNFEYFEIFDRTGTTSMLDPYSEAAAHLTTLYVYTRFDSHVMLPEAFASITV